MSEAAKKPSKGNESGRDQAKNVDQTSVLECYTTRSGSRLADLFQQMYSPEAKFADPFVVAGPRHEARLQFLSLQHFFESVTATANSTTTSGNETRMDVHFDYYWARNSWFSRIILPEVTPVDAVVVLQTDPVTGKIISHVDDWRSPAIAALPTSVREINAKASNAVFRLLGWESELKPQMKSETDGRGFAAAATTAEFGAGAAEGNATKED